MTVKTVAEYGNRLAKMLAYFTAHNIEYKVYENKSGVLCVSVFFESKDDERKANTYETDLLIQEKIDSHSSYDNIKDLRLATKMTQQAFGDYFGVPLRSVQDWEYGYRECREYLVRLMEYKLRNCGVIK